MANTPPNLTVPVFLVQFGASRRWRAATQIAGQAIMGAPGDNEMTAVQNLFAALAGVNHAGSGSVELALDLALSGFASVAELTAGSDHSAG